MIYLLDALLFTALAAALIAAVAFMAGIRVVRPTGRGLVERLGKYRRLAMPGFNWVVPGIERMFLVNVTEVMVNAEPREIITSDKLNARVDAQVYFKANLARTTLRNSDETTHRGIEIVRTELEEIDPPADVQETMNKVVKAENERAAAIDFATATETIADGARRAEIERAEGVKQAKILEAEGEAIQLVNRAAEKYFVGNAQLLRRLITVERALQASTKIVVPSNTELVNVIGDLAGILPMHRSNGDQHNQSPWVAPPAWSRRP